MAVGTAGVPGAGLEVKQSVLVRPGAQGPAATLTSFTPGEGK